MKKTAVITGANRGIGLELTHQLYQKGFNVYALCRKASSELKNLNVNWIENVELTEMDVDQKVKKILKEVKIDLLINNAGILKSEDLLHLDSTATDAIERQFQVNALAPLRLSAALCTQMTKGSKIIMITSRMGSIEDNTSGGHYGYRMSKAALNAAAKSLSVDLKSKDIIVGIVHPGYVRTEMTGGNGLIDPSESAKGIMERIEEFNLENSGTFFHSNGERLPW